MQPKLNTRFTAICAWVFALLPIGTYGQLRTDEGYLRIAETGEVSGAVKALNSNVDLASGTGTISIPVLEMQTNDLTIPITLTYQTTGIRVTDLNNGPLGIGWNMTGGGKITRIIRGSSDIRWPMEEFKNMEQVWSDVENPYRMHNYESDLYFYETPTVTGLFILDANLNAVPIPYQNVEIVWHSTDLEDGYFTIRDSSGNEYVFGKTASTRENTELQTHYTMRDDDPYTYTSTWHLDQITSLKGERVTYTYNTAKEFKYETAIEMYDYQRIGSKPFTYFANGAVRTEMTVSAPKELAEIAWGTNAKITFYRYNGLLNSIHLSAKVPSGTTEESVSLSYLKNYNGSLLAEIRKNNRLLYRFDYYNAKNVALKKNHDWWGYHNLNGGNAGDYKNQLYAPNRSPDLESARYHTLKTITFPDGGTQEYIYELNDGYTASGEYMQIGGLRVAAIKADAGDGQTHTVRYEYKKADGRSSGVLFANGVKAYYDTYEPMYDQYIRTYADQPFNELFDINQRSVTYAVVREIDGERTTEYRFSTALDPEARDLTASIYHYHREAPSQLINKPKDIIDNLRPFSVGNIDFCNTSRFWRRGLLREKSVFDKQGQLVSAQKYEYDFGSAPKREVVNYQYYINEILYGTGSYKADTYVSAYRWLSEPVILKSTETVAGSYSLPSRTEYTYDTDYLVPTAEVMTDCRGDVWSTTTTYPFSYTIDTSATTSSEIADAASALQWLKEHRLPVPVETVHRKNGNLVKAELNEYGFPSWKSYALPVRKYVLNPTSFGAAFEAYDIASSDSRYALKTEYCCYDSKGRLVRSTTDHITESEMYDATSPLPIAKIRHAAYDPFEWDINQVFYISFEDDGKIIGNSDGYAKTGSRVHEGIYTASVYLGPGTYRLSYWDSSDNGMTWSPVHNRFTHEGGEYRLEIGKTGHYLDEVRIHPEHAQMETYTYRSYRKKSTESGIDGTTTYYQYDNKGRLIRELDDEHHISAEYEYNTLLN